VQLGGDGNRNISSGSTAEFWFDGKKCEVILLVDGVNKGVVFSQFPKKKMYYPAVFLDNHNIMCDIVTNYKVASGGGASEGVTYLTTPIAAASRLASAVASKGVIAALSTALFGSPNALLSEHLALQYARCALALQLLVAARLCRVVLTIYVAAAVVTAGPRRQHRRSPCCRCSSRPLSFWAYSIRLTRRLRRDP
jgi:hypothetical protein